MLFPDFDFFPFFYHVLYNKGQKKDKDGDQRDPDEDPGNDFHFKLLWRGMHLKMLAGCKRFEVQAASYSLLRLDTCKYAEFQCSETMLDAVVTH